MQHFPHIQVKIRLVQRDTNVGKSPSLNIRLEKTGPRRKATRAFAPRFPKVKDSFYLK